MQGELGEGNGIANQIETKEGNRGEIGGEVAKSGEGFTLGVVELGLGNAKVEG